MPPPAKPPLDLDGMTVMTDAHVPTAPSASIVPSNSPTPPAAPEVDHFEQATQSPEEKEEEEEIEELPWEKNPETANWAPMMEEVKFLTIFDHQDSSILTCNSLLDLWPELALSFTRRFAHWQS